MTDAEVTRVDDVEHLIAPIVLAFAADPFVRWLMPGPDQFLATCTQVTRLHGRRTAANGGAYGRLDGRGAAFWYPPGIHPDGEALGAVLESTGVLERFAGVWEQVAAYQPSVPHWYLRQIGMDPATQGNGHGASLLEAGLAEVRRSGEIAYLEATSARGRGFYERHGFITLGEIRVGDSAPLWPMLFEPG